MFRECKSRLVYFVPCQTGFRRKTSENFRIRRLRTGGRTCIEDGEVDVTAGYRSLSNVGEVDSHAQMVQVLTDASPTNSPDVLLDNR